MIGVAPRVPPGLPPAPDADSSMRAAARIGRNFSFRMAAQILSALINVGAMVLLGNYLNAAGYGDYVFYYALIPLIASLSDLGAGVMITKGVARDKLLGPRFYGDAILIKAAVGVPLLAVVGFTSWALLDPARAALVTLVCATALIDFSQDVSVWIVRAHERLDLEAVLLLVSQLAWIGGIALGAALHRSLPWLLAAATGAFLMRTAAGVWIVQRRFYRPRFDPDLARLRAFAAEALPFGLAMFIVVLYGRIGVLMLQAMASKTDVALFNVGYMLSQPLGFVSTALSMAAFPVLARRAQRGHAAISSALRRTSKYQVLVTLPLTVGLFLLSDRVIPLLLHGADFARAGFALRLMSLGLAFIFINLMSRYVLAALDRQRTYLRAVLVGLALNLAVGVLLIPRLGFAGACIAQLAGEASILVMCQRALTSYVRTGELLRLSVRPALAAFGMAVVVWLLHSWNLGLVVVTGAVTYGALLFALRAFTDEELKLMRGVLASFHVPGAASLDRAEPRS